MIRSGRIAVLVLALVLLVGVASAQPRDVANADALFREGRALFKKGEYEAACPKLEESYRLDPAAGTGVSLGDCFEKNGKVASALLAYQAARALLQPGDPRIGPVEKEISALEKRTPRLAIRLAPGAPEGSVVKRDGREVEASKLRAPVVVNPGKHKIVVTAPGREAGRYNVTLVEGQTRELVVEPGEQTLAPSGSATATTGGEHRSMGGTDGAQPGGPAPGSSQRTWGYGFIVGGCIASATGAVFWKLAVDTHEEPCPSGDCTDLNTTEGDQRTVATVAGIAGFVALAGGVSLLLLAPDSPDETAELRATPTVGRTGWAINVGGTW